MGFGVEYGTARPGVRRVMEIANLDGSGLFEEGSAGIVGLGTGIYVLTRETLDCFWTWCSGSGEPSAWTLTAMPLKHGILLPVICEVTKLAPKLVRLYSLLKKVGLSRRELKGEPLYLELVGAGGS